MPSVSQFKHRNSLCLANRMPAHPAGGLRKRTDPSGGPTAAAVEIESYGAMSILPVSVLASTRARPSPPHFGSSLHSLPFLCIFRCRQSEQNAPPGSRWQKRFDIFPRHQLSERGALARIPIGSSNDGVKSAFECFVRDFQCLGQPEQHRRTLNMVIDVSGIARLVSLTSISTLAVIFGKPSKPVFFLTTIPGVTITHAFVQSVFEASVRWRIDVEPFDSSPKLSRINAWVVRHVGGKAEIRFDQSTMLNQLVIRASQYLVVEYHTGRWPSIGQT